ncbi:hypothetical protein EBS02_01870 [bacterium]|nr:hypothetical protein [bacterium]
MTKPFIGLFINHPECSIQCATGMYQALQNSFNFRFFFREEISASLFHEIDIISFPGGIGDADAFDVIFSKKMQDKIYDYVQRGGRYLGVCMGAYWASSSYFNILNEVECIQYIKVPDAKIKRSYATTALVSWKDSKENMFFYDGCTFKGKEKYDMIASYETNHPMAIYQNKIGLIGCHPESMEYWYNKSYLKKRWHQYKHHQLLENFALELMER